MPKTIKLGKIPVEVVLKNIKNIHLSVYPPDGNVRISAPSRMKLDAIRVYATSKLGWIKSQQKKLRDQDRETNRECLDRESHFVWGQRHLMKVIEHDSKPLVRLTPRQVRMQVRPGTSLVRRQEILGEWYRDQIREAVPALIAKWEKKIGVKVSAFYIQRMKTKWGSCNSAAKTIRLNSELAKKPRNCLEYIIVHEMAHIIEPTHNERFVALMDHHMPDWQFQRESLNRLPIRADAAISVFAKI